MIDIILLIVGIVLLLTLIVGFPFLLILKPIKNINFLDINDESSLILNERQLEAFNAVKITNAEKGDAKILTFFAKEETSYAYVTVVFKGKKKTTVKRYRLNFKKQSDASIIVKKGFEEVTFFINQLNDEVYKEKVYQEISRAKINTFIALEYSTFVLFMADIVAYFIFAYKTLQANMALGLTYIIVTLVLAFASYPVFYLSTKWCFEKYIKGGFVDERN